MRRRILFTGAMVGAIVLFLFINKAKLDAAADFYTNESHSAYLVNQAQMIVDEIAQKLAGQNPYGFDSKPLESMYIDIYKDLSVANKPVGMLSYKGKPLTDKKLRELIHLCLDQRMTVKTS